MATKGNTCTCMVASENAISSRIYGHQRKYMYMYSVYGSFQKCHFIVHCHKTKYSNYFFEYYGSPVQRSLCLPCHFESREGPGDKFALVLAYLSMSIK